MNTISEKEGIGNRNASRPHPIPYTQQRRIGGENETHHSQMHLMYIFTGAFTGVEANEKEEARHIGFADKAVTDGDKYAFVELRDSLAKAGVIPKFLGRINTVVRTKPLTEAQIFRAVRYAPESAIQTQKRFLTEMGITLHVNNDYVKKTIAKVIGLGLGVRGCNNIIDDNIKKKTYEAFEMGKKSIWLGRKGEIGSTEIVFEQVN